MLLVARNSSWIFFGQPGQARITNVLFHQMSPFFISYPSSRLLINYKPTPCASPIKTNYIDIKNLFAFNAIVTWLENDFYRRFKMTWPSSGYVPHVMQKLPHTEQRLKIIHQSDCRCFLINSYFIIRWKIFDLIFYNFFSFFFSFKICIFSR